MTAAVPRAGEIMNRRATTLRPEAPLYDALRLLVAARGPGLAVVDARRRFVGVFTGQSLMRAVVQAIQHGQPVGPVREHLDREPPALSEETTLLTVVHLFAEGGGRHSVLPVLRDGRFAGTITRLDVARALQRILASGQPLDDLLPYWSALDEGTAFRTR